MTPVQMTFLLNPIYFNNSQLGKQYMTYKVYHLTLSDEEA